MFRPMVIIDLNLDELYYESFITSLDRCDVIFNNAEDPFDRTYLSNEMEKMYIRKFST